MMMIMMIMKLSGIKQNKQKLIISFFETVFNYFNQVLISVLLSTRFIADFQFYFQYAVKCVNEIFYYSMYSLDTQ